MNKHSCPAFVLFFALTTLCLNTTAQTYETCRQVIGAYGGSATTGPWQLSYTVGEVVTKTLEGELNLASQGFHQPEPCLLIEVGTEPLLAEWNLQLYPNPTSASLHIAFQEQIPAANIKLQITDPMGAAILPPQGLADLPRQNLDCSILPAGLYYIHLIDQNTGQQLALPFIKILE